MTVAARLATNALSTIILTAAVLGGCAGPRPVGSHDRPPRVDTQVALSPEARARLRDTTLAVLTFERVVMGKVDGKDASGLADRVAAALVANGYRVVERAKLDRVLAEARFSLSDFVDEHRAPQIGEVLGAGVLVFGTIAYDAPLDAKSASLDLKFVDATTGEVVGTMHASGKSKEWRTWEEWAEAFSEGFEENLSPP